MGSKEGEEPPILRKQSVNLVVRSLKEPDGTTQSGYELQPGDVIKFGRIDYKVVEMQTGSDESTRKTI